MVAEEKLWVVIIQVKQLALVLKSMNVGIDNKELLMAVLMGLSPNFDHFTVALDAIGDENERF